MQSRLVNVALSLLLIFFVTELLFCSVAALPDWRKEPMIFPCGSGENVNKGEGVRRNIEFLSLKNVRF